MDKRDVFALCTILLLCLVMVSDGQNTCEHLTDEAIFKPYVKIGKSYYIVNATTEATWFKANHLCRNKNGYLASIESLDELEALSSYLKTMGLSNDKWFWLSGTDLAHVGNFVWLGTGEDIPKYTWLWEKGEPNNNDKNEHCVIMRLSGKTYSLADETCTEKGFYICEIDKEMIKMQAMLSMFSEILPGYMKCPLAKREEGK